MPFGGHIVKNKSYTAGFLTGMATDYYNDMSERCVVDFNMMNGFLNSTISKYDLSYGYDEKLIRHIFIELFGELITLYTKDGVKVYCALGDYDGLDDEETDDNTIQCLFYSERNGWCVSSEIVKSLSKKRPKVARVERPKPEPKPAPIDDEECEVVKKLEVDGKKYLVGKVSQIVYDYNEYVKNGEQVILGKYNGTTIDFNDDKTDNWCECCLCGKELTDAKSTLIDDDGATICVCLECANE